MSSILVVQTAYVGDVVMTTPLLRELRRVHPHARITVVATEAGRQTLAGLPYHDEVIVFDKRWQASIGGFLRLALSLRRRRFDAAIAAQRSSRTGQLLWASGAPVRVGFAGAPGAWAYLQPVPWEGTKHAVDRYLELSRPLGGDPAAADPRPTLTVDPVAMQRAATLLGEVGLSAEEPWLCVCPGSARATKRWLPEGFAAVIRDAAGRGLRSVLVGNADERALCETIAAGSGAGPVVLAGRTGISEWIGLIASARAVLANDSGAGHVAAAVGTPVLSIFGPSAPSSGYAPRGLLAHVVAHPTLECRPCAPHGPRTCPLGHWRCMRELEAATVSAALRELLETSRGRSQSLAVRPG